jgi:hypothetical protein
LTNSRPPLAPRELEIRNYVEQQLSPLASQGFGCARLPFVSLVSWFPLPLLASAPPHLRVSPSTAPPNWKPATMLTNTSRPAHRQSADHRLPPKPKKEELHCHNPLSYMFLRRKNRLPSHRMPHRWGRPLFTTRYPATTYNYERTPRTLEAGAKPPPPPQKTTSFRAETARTCAREPARRPETDRRRLS